MEDADDVASLRDERDAETTERKKQQKNMMLDFVLVPLVPLSSCS